MRILFTGAHGTGKTSLAELMEKDGSFGDIYRHPSMARIFQGIGFKINKDADPLSQMLVWTSTITKELTVTGEDANKIVISDRGPCDALAYTKHQLTNEWDLPVQAKMVIWSQMATLTQYFMGGYDKIFYFPPYFEPEDDGTRLTDRVYQLDIDQYLKEILDGCGVPYMIVPDIDLEERLLWIKGKMYAEL